jgi:hypothetical protein
MYKFPMNASCYCFAVLIGVCPTQAISQPSAEQACQYFLSDAPIVGSARDAHYRTTTVPEFQDIGKELDRYQTLASVGILVEFGQISDGNFELRGAISASAVCTVDLIDRRVIQMKILDGPIVGSNITNANGDTRRIQGPNEISVDIGSLSHAGKY